MPTGRPRIKSRLKRRSAAPVIDEVPEILDTLAAFDIVMVRGENNGLFFLPAYWLTGLLKSQIIRNQDALRKLAPFMSAQDRAALAHEKYKHIRPTLRLVKSGAMPESTPASTPDTTDNDEGLI